MQGGEGSEKRLKFDERWGRGIEVKEGIKRGTHEILFSKGYTLAVYSFFSC